MTKGYEQTPEHVAKRIKSGPAHPHWQGDDVSDRGGRARALRRYPNASCEECDSAKGERHHVDGNTANNRPENIRMLCRRCHMRAHPEIAQAASRRIAKVSEAAAAARRAQATCKRGHPLSGENLYINPHGKRICKACRKIHKRASAERKAAM